MDGAWEAAGERKPAAGAETEHDFVRIVQTYRRALTRYLFRRTRDYHLAEDLCQETFFRAYVALPNLESPRRVKSWLYSIAYHVSVDWLRGHTARKRTQETLEDRSCNMAAGAAGVDEILIDREERALRKLKAERLWSKVLDLPPIYREVFEQRYRHLSPIAQISGRIGVSEGSVKVRLYRARRLLLRLLERAAARRKRSSAG